jgi:hypothetical protein
MMVPEDPPGFIVRTEAQKAGWDNGFRLERGVERGGWLRYGSTTARCEIWIAGVAPRGPWLLSIDHPGVAAELSSLPSSPPTRARPCHLRPGHPDRAACRARPCL